MLLRYNAGMEHELLTVQKVNDLEDSGKRWLECVFGRHLKENQQVFIMAFTPGAQPDEASRRQALASVKQTMSTVEKNLSAAGVSDEEFDTAVDEAMEDVRRRHS
jgi:hypothetical protein